MTVIAAWAAAILMTGLAGFHVALALGAPWGAYAWGGQHRGVIPSRLQIGSAISAPVLLALAIMVLIRAGVVYPVWAEAMAWPVWIAFLYLVMNTFANFRSESAEERRVMTPLAGVLALLVGYVSWTLG